MVLSKHAAVLPRRLAGFGRLRPPMATVIQDRMRNKAIRFYQTSLYGHFDILNLFPLPVKRHSALNPTVPSLRNPPSGAVVMGIDKDKAAAKHEKYKRTQPTNTTWVYTDGSMLQSGWLGAGWAVYQGGQLKSEGSFPCGSRMEVVDAEAKAIRLAVQNLTPKILSKSGPIYICSDNQSVVLLINNPRYCMRTSRREIDGARKGIGRIQSTHNIYVIWVPGHCGIEGNKRADKLAKAAALVHPYMPQAWAGRWTTFARAGSAVSRIHWRKLVFALAWLVPIVVFVRPGPAASKGNDVVVDACVKGDLI